MALLVLLSACSNSDKRTLETFTNAFTDAGVVMEGEGDLLYQMVGAQNGTLFYNGSKVVKIYEYEDEKALQEAVKEYTMMADWPQNGKFILETSDEQAIEIFMAVAK